MALAAIPVALEVLSTLAKSTALVTKLTKPFRKGPVLDLLKSCDETLEATEHFILEIGEDRELIALISEQQWTVLIKRHEMYVNLSPGYCFEGDC